MKVLPIGSFDVFINIPAAYVSLLPDSEKENIAESIHAEFRKRLTAHELNVQVHSWATYRQGCLITTIIISIVIPASALALGKGIYTFIKDYDKLKANIKLIREDFKNVFLSRKKKKKTEPAKAGGISSSQKSIDYEILKQMPAEFQKAYEAGKEIYLEKTTTCYKICIMRDDIKETISEADIKEEAIEVEDVKQPK